MLWPPPGAFREIHPWTHSTLDRACFVMFHCFLRAISFLLLNTFLLSGFHSFPFTPSSCYTWHRYICTLHRLWSELRSGLGVNGTFLCSSPPLSSLPTINTSFCVLLRQREKSLEEVKQTISTSDECFCACFQVTRCWLGWKNGYCRNNAENERLVINCQFIVLPTVYMRQSWTVGNVNNRDGSCQSRRCFLRFSLNGVETLSCSRVALRDSPTRLA